MKLTARDYLTAIAAAATAGLGGVAIVLAEIDDAPGGVLIGFLMIVGSAGFSLWAAKRRS